MKRKYNLVAALVAVALLGFGTSIANALPVHLSVNSAQSQINIFISALGGAATGNISTSVGDDFAPLESPFATPLPNSLTSPAIDPLPSRPGLAPPFGTYTGGLDAEAGSPLATSISKFIIRAGEVDLSNAGTTISLGGLGSVSAGSNNVGASLTSPLLMADSSSGNMSFFNPLGTILTLDQGGVTYSGSGAVGGLLGSGSYNFDTSTGGSHQTFAIPSLPGTVKITKSGNNLTVLIPLNITTTLTTDPIQVDATLSGQIVLTGTMVPEPGTIVLMVLGACALVPAAVRRFRKSA